MALFGKNSVPGDRDWTTKDQHNDRSIPEKPVSKNHLAQNRPQVDAIPELHYRPGRRN